MEPRVLILTANSSRHIYFANEISKCYNVVGIAAERRFSKDQRVCRFLKGVNYNPYRVLTKIWNKARLYGIDGKYKKAETELLLRGGRGKFFPKITKVLETGDINSAEVAYLIKETRPDIILVSGPSLIRQNIIDLAPEKGIINMHTGLSPYYRGGPCTFWCLMNEELEYLGVTVHHLTAGIDSGDIILSEREVSIEPDDNEATLDCKVIKRGVNLMIEAVRLVFEGRAPRVKQWLKGRNYLFRYFTPEVRLSLERKLRNGLVKRWLVENKGRLFEDIKCIRAGARDKKETCV